MKSTFAGDRFRVAAVGASATVTHVALAYIAHGWYGFDSDSSNRIGFIFALVFSYYILHRLFFFSNDVRSLHLSRFGAIALVFYLCSHLITFAVVQVVRGPQILALEFIILAMTLLSYLVFKCRVLCSKDVKKEVEWMLIGVIGSLVIVVQIWTVLYGSSFNHDTSWYFIAVRMWMDGSPLYSKVMEINPPLFFYFIRAVLMVADWLSLRDDYALRGVLFVLGGFSIALFLRVIRVWGISRFQEASMVGFATVALFVVPLGTFGQREHLFLILLLPYIAAFAVRMAGVAVPSGIRIVCLAFVIPGLLLKPYFLILPAFLSLYEWVVCRNWRSLFSFENLSIGLSCGVYVVFVYIVHRDYFEIVVPMGRLVYYSFGRSALSIVSDPLVFVALLPTFLIFSQDRDRGERRFAIALLVGSIALLGAYLIQFKGWGYQALPYWGVSIVLVGFLLVSRTSGVQRIFSVLTFALALMAIVLPSVQGGPYSSLLSRQLRDVLGNVSGRTMMVYSSNVSAAFPMVNDLGLVWTSRYPAQWIAPGAFVGLKNSVSSQQATPFKIALNYARQTAVDDFVLNRPDFVLVDIRPIKSYFSGYTFDWIEFLSEDERFASEWSTYVWESNLAGFGVWRRSP